MTFWLVNVHAAYSSLEVYIGVYTIVYTIAVQ